MKEEWKENLITLFVLSPLLIALLVVLVPIMYLVFRYNWLLGVALTAYGVTWSYLVFKH